MTHEAPEPVSWDPVDPAGLTLAEVLSLLRARCPWAAEHTHESLAPFLLEETYELLEAIEQHSKARNAQSLAELKKELGDVLYQVLFHAAVLDAPQPHSQPTGQAAQPVAFAEVEQLLKDKIVRRHPHVFESTAPWTLEEVEDMYEKTKARERQAEGTQAAKSSFDSLPRTMPALARAAAVVDRAQRMGWQLQNPAGTSADNPAGTSAEEERIGRELLDLVTQARSRGVDPEKALRRATEAAEDATLSHNAHKRG